MPPIHNAIYRAYEVPKDRELRKAFREEVHQKLQQLMREKKIVSCGTDPDWARGILYVSVTCARNKYNEVENALNALKSN